MLHIGNSERDLICHLSGVASRPDYGRTRPVRVLVETDDGSEFEAYMKGPHLGDSQYIGLMEREWFAGRLAKHLKLPCAPAMQIVLTPQVIESITDPVLRTKLLEGPDVLFGSLSGGPGWIEWSDAMRISRRRIQGAAEIYLFDTIIQNWDRTAYNPNLLVRGDKLLMIDHGEAFVDATGEDAERDYHPAPWKLGGISNHAGEFDMHALWPKLRPRNRVDFAAAASIWKALPTDTFNLIASEVPSCWSMARASRIAAYLTEAVENLPKIVGNIEYNFNR